MRAHMPSVVLVSMPWAAADRPALGLGLLSALARRDDVPCRVAYPNLDLAATLGPDLYRSFSETPVLFGLAEHFFSVAIFGAQPLDSDTFLTRFARSDDGAIDDRARAAFERLRDTVVPQFIETCASRLVDARADVYGFSCTFHQVMASLSVARLLKQARPAARIVFGGACVHGEMGTTYASMFRDWIDHVFVGEADESFPAFLAAVRAGAADEGTVPGVTARGVLRQAPRLVTRLDDLPDPDYDEYFAEHQAMVDRGLSLPVSAVPFEASRGCWWGTKHHCSFCGLNNEGMAYRQKSPARIEVEIERLASRYGHLDFMAADNILAANAYRTLLERLHAHGSDYRLFFEIKSNIGRHEAAALAAAGVRWVQPGVEHFADRVLALMHKGVTGLQNAHMLRLLREYGIEPSYNILVGFPGERDEDYADLLQVIAGLVHLASPSGEATLVQVHRFSPFHMRPDDYGLEPLRPAPFYAHLVPASLGDASRFAYFFERDLDAAAPVWRHLPTLNAAIGAWQRAGLRRFARLGAGFVEVLEERAGTPCGRSILKGPTAAALVLADRPVAVDALVATVSRTADIDPADARREVETLVLAGALLRVRERVVSVLPYSRPQTDESLARWIARHFTGAPQASATGAPPASERPARQRTMAASPQP